MLHYKKFILKGISNGIDIFTCIESRLMFLKTSF